jgi:hypothetical protein
MRCSRCGTEGLLGMMDAAQHYGGYIVQSTGDGIFALFGAPVAHEDHPQRALFAALRLQDQLKRYSNTLRGQFRGRPQVRALQGSPGRFPTQKVENHSWTTRPVAVSV